MATFKMGQRVKRVQTGPSCGLFEIPLGATGTVLVPIHFLSALALGSTLTQVAWDNNLPTDWSVVRTDTLAPLTDPKADEFIERIRKMKPDPMELVRSSGGSAIRIVLPERY